jgi:zinc transport system substrate-binding protein
MNTYTFFTKKNRRRWDSPFRAGSPHAGSSLRIHPVSQTVGLLPCFFTKKSEEVGFEPTKRFHVYTLSKRAPSATRTLLQKMGIREASRLADGLLTYNIFVANMYDTKEIYFYMKILRHSSSIFVISLLALFFTSCGKSEKSSSSVLVSVAPYTYFVNKISSGTLPVHTLVPVNSDPHIFEPTPKQIADISAAPIWFCIGEPFENKILKTLKERSPQLRIVDLSEGVTLIGEEGHSHCCHDEGKDRHIWLSPKLAMGQAKRIAEALTQLFPEKKEIFAQGLHQFLVELEALDSEITALLSPHKGQAILVSHPAFGYFCKDYGLVQLSIESEGKDPLPRHVTTTLLMAKKHRVRSVLLQNQHNNKGATLIAKELQLPLFTVDPYSADLVGNMRSVAQLIAKKG